MIFAYQNQPTLATNRKYHYEFSEYATFPNRSLNLFLAISHNLTNCGVVKPSLEHA